MTVSRSKNQILQFDAAVVIATLNRDEMLRQTLADLASQETLPGVCIVVDQGEKQNKDDMLAPLVEKGVRCEWVFSSYKSISAARNIGLERCRPARVVIYIDDDVELLTDVVAIHSSYYADEPETVAVAGHVTCTPISPEFDRLNTFRPQGVTVSHGRGCHMSYRADVLRQIGGFNAYICNNGDETELYRRLTRAGYSIRNGERAILKHLVCGNGGNRQVGLRSHANYGRVIRDGMIRLVKDRGFAPALAWPLKNWRTFYGLCRSAPSLAEGLSSVARELSSAWRLAKLSQRKQDYIPLSITLSAGVGVDSKTGLPTI